MLLIPPQNIKESFIHFSDTPSRRKFLLRHHLSHSLPNWLPQRDISRVLFGKQGVKIVLNCEKSYGPFLWAPEFANVHSTFNFQEHPIVIGGKTFACTEAYYQAMKSLGTPSHSQALQDIQNAGPAEAFSFGQQYGLRDDWSTARVNVMRKAIRAKFTQNNKLKELLLATGEYPLVQIKMDDFWGTNADGSGKNMLGQLLMELRTQLRSGAITKSICDTHSY